MPDILGLPNRNSTPCHALKLSSLSAVSSDSRRRSRVCWLAYMRVAAGRTVSPVADRRACPSLLITYENASRVWAAASAIPPGYRPCPASYRPDSMVHTSSAAYPWFSSACTPSLRSSPDLTSSRMNRSLSGRSRRSCRLCTRTSRPMSRRRGASAASLASRANSPCGSSTINDMPRCCMYDSRIIFARTDLPEPVLPNMPRCDASPVPPSAGGPKWRNQLGMAVLGMPAPGTRPIDTVCPAHGAVRAAMAPPSASLTGVPVGGTVPIEPCAMRPCPSSTKTALTSISAACVSWPPVMGSTEPCCRMSPLRVGSRIKGLSRETSVTCPSAYAARPSCSKRRTASAPASERAAFEPSTSTDRRDVLDGEPTTPTCSLASTAARGAGTAPPVSPLPPPKRTHVLYPRAAM